MSDLPLDTVLDVRARTRRAARIGWIPLAVFAVVVAGSIAVTETNNGYPYLGSRSAFHGLPLYWIVALPVAYLVCVVLVEWRARRIGVRSSVSTYVVAGVALVAAYLLASLTGLFGGVADFTARGTAPTVSVGLALFALALAQRSRTLLLSAVVVTAAALTASLYNVENVAYRIGLPDSAVAGSIANQLFLAVVLVLCAGAVALSTRRRSVR